MKKIVLPFNGGSLKPGLIKFGCSIVSLSQSPLTGIFLNSSAKTLPADSRSYFAETGKGVLQKEPVQMDAEQCVRFFIDACMKHGVKANVLLRGRLQGKNAPVEEVLYESRFADVLILDPEISFQQQRESAPSSLAKEVLTAAECPVILAPAVFDGIDEIALCYDGGRSSVYAIKQFTYLFPELHSKKLTVLEVCEEGDCFTEKEKIRNWLNSYYPQTDFKLLSGAPEDQLLQYFLLRKNVFIVMGAYGRNFISSLFRRSSADLVMRVVDLPLFIAHNT